MPELPEVETMRRGLLPTIGGIVAAINEPVIPFRPIKIEPTIQQFRKRALDAKILAVDRIAKRILIRLSTGDSIVMQPKMAGIAMIADPPSQQHTRLVFELQGATVDRFLYWDRPNCLRQCVFPSSVIG